MNLKRTFTLLAAGGLVAAFALGLTAFVALEAQASNSQVDAPLDARFHGIGRDSGEYLAEALGISEEELEAAYQAASEAAINEALDAGLITQAQADDLLARGATLPFGGRFTPWLIENGIDFEALLAEELGISVEELQEAQTEAANLRLEAAVESGRITEEEAELIRARQALIGSESFQSAILAAVEAAVNQAVESGLITQAQADLILENLPETGGLGHPGGFGLPGIFGGPGGFGRHGGPGGPGGFFSPDAPASTTPASST